MTHKYKSTHTYKYHITDWGNYFISLCTFNSCEVTADIKSHSLNVTDIQKSGKVQFNKGRADGGDG